MCVPYIKVWYLNLSAKDYVPRGNSTAMAEVLNHSLCVVSNVITYISPCTNNPVHMIGRFHVYRFLWLKVEPPNR